MTQKNVRILGIHLGGAHTRKTALARGFVSIAEACTGLPAGPHHEIVAAALRPFLSGVPISPEQSGSAQGVSPFILDSICPDVGPQMRTDGDTRLVEVVADMGGADVIALDAALTSPPCGICEQKACEGFLHCDVPEVAAMRGEWENAKNKGNKRTRMPLPYLDRYFEVLARLRFEHPSLSGSFEFESVQGSGRAPLTARAHHLARRLQGLYPQALIVEVNSAAAALGWTLMTGFRPHAVSDLRQELENRGTRAHVLKRLETSHLLTRSASLDEGLHLEVAQRPELFLAAMTALTVRGLFSGDVYIIPEFLSIKPEAPLQGWALLPRDIIEYGWQH